MSRVIGSSLQAAAVALALVASLTALAAAQEPRLARLPEAARAPVDSVLRAADRTGLPTDPLLRRALEGAAKGASPQLIVAAVIRLEGELARTRQAFGETATQAELVAGASALRAGATPGDLARLRSLRADQPLTVAAAVLADLVASGVPAANAVGAVLALAANAADADYLSFRRNVQRDIALGASPAAALGVRLKGLGDLASNPGSEGQGPGSPQQRPRRP